MKRDWLLLVLLLVLILAGGGIFVYEKFKSRADFLRAILPDAKRLEDLTGIKTKITLTQAAYESGSGNSDLVRASHNLFGIKAGSSWKGALAPPTLTHEEKNGVSVPVKATDRQEMFRAYPSFYDSMLDWSSLLARIYPQAYAAAKAGDLQAFARGLQNGKYGPYATKSSYSLELVQTGQSIEGIAV